MQALTAGEAKKWCMAQGAPLRRTGFPERPTRAASFAIPNESGRRVALVANHLDRDFLGSKGKTLVWFHDWGVWPSGERMHFFRRLLASYGETRPLIELPAFLFTR